MSCIKDFLEIVYYIAFIFLTWRLVKYARDSFKLEAARNYELLCKLSLREETFGDYDFGFALEIYNAGNLAAKNVDILIDGQKITTADFIKPNDSFLFPIGTVGQMIASNRADFGRIKAEEGKPLNVILCINGNNAVYSLCTDILFASRGLNTGTLKGIEDKLNYISKAIDTEYQRKKRGY